MWTDTYYVGCNAEVTGYPGEVRIPDSGTGLVDMNLDSIGDLTIADIDGDGAEDIVAISRTQG